MNLKELMVESKSAWVEFPGLEGFEIEIVNLGREKLIEMRKSCMHERFDRKTRLPISELDEKKFVKVFTKESVKNWKGFKLSDLEQIMLTDIGDADPEAELPFSEENAVLLVTNSPDFDNWLNDAVFDLSNFRSKRD